MDKELLFKPRLTERDVNIEGIGVVRVRALSQAEAEEVSEIQGVSARNRRILELGMVDPSMTAEDVDRWRAAGTGGEITKVALEIAEMSGLLQGAAKAAYKSFRGES